MEDLRTVDDLSEDILAFLVSSGGFDVPESVTVLPAEDLDNIDACYEQKDALAELVSHKIRNLGPGFERAYYISVVGAEFYTVSDVRRAVMGLVKEDLYAEDRSEGDVLLRRFMCDFDLIDIDVFQHDFLRAKSKFDDIRNYTANFTKGVDNEYLSAFINYAVQIYMECSGTDDLEAIMVRLVNGEWGNIYPGDEIDVLTAWITFLGHHYPEKALPFLRSLPAELLAVDGEKDEEALAYMQSEVLCAMEKRNVDYQKYKKLWLKAWYEIKEDEEFEPRALEAKVLVREGKDLNKPLLVDRGLGLYRELELDFHVAETLITQLNGWYRQFEASDQREMLFEALSIFESCLGYEVVQVYLDNISKAYLLAGTTKQEIFGDTLGFIKAEDIPDNINEAAQAIYNIFSDGSGDIVHIIHLGLEAFEKWKLESGMEAAKGVVSELNISEDTPEGILRTLLDDDSLFELDDAFWCGDINRQDEVWRKMIGTGAENLETQYRFAEAFLANGELKAFERRAAIYSERHRDWLCIESNTKDGIVDMNVNVLEQFLSSDLKLSRRLLTPRVESWNFLPNEDLSERDFARIISVYLNKIGIAPGVHTGYWAIGRDVKGDMLVASAVSPYVPNSPPEIFMGFRNPQEFEESARAALKKEGIVESGSIISKSLNMGTYAPQNFVGVDQAPSCVRLAFDEMPSVYPEREYIIMIATSIVRRSLKRDGLSFAFFEPPEGLVLTEEEQEAAIQEHLKPEPGMLPKILEYYVRSPAMDPRTIILWKN